MLPGSGPFFKLNKNKRRGEGEFCPVLYLIQGHGSYSKQEKIEGSCFFNFENDFLMVKHNNFSKIFSKFVLTNSIVKARLHTTKYTNRIARVVFTDHFNPWAMRNEVLEN